MRFGAAAVAALSLWVNLAVALHYASTPHTICPEHGELLHVDATESLGTAAAGVSSARDEASFDHDLAQCPSTPALRDRLDAPAGAGLPVLAAALLEPRPAVSYDFSVAGQTYRLAPKTSPPA
jgi:hypothetical protein